jgi:DNA helicase-2/ATP-dependent DNA helicase PcrA
VFTEQVLALAQARADKFAVGRIVREHSPLTSAEAFRDARDEGEQLRRAQAAVDALLALLEPGRSATVRDIARHLGETQLFPLHERVRMALDKDAEVGPVLEADKDEPLDVRSEIDAAVDAFLDAPFSEIEPYARYVAGRARFDTHQGVKGLEFKRVMLVMDDTEARGFQFKYEKLFGPANADDAVAAATRRLFYVTCSRAERSLALVAYTPQPDRIRDYVINHGWFDTDEVIIGVPK